MRARLLEDEAVEVDVVDLVMLEDLQMSSGRSYGSTCG